MLVVTQCWLPLSQVPLPSQENGEEAKPRIMHTSSQATNSKGEGSQVRQGATVVRACCPPCLLCTLLVVT